MFPLQPKNDKKYKEDQITNAGEVSDVRKYMHREIERQRRQEMANLCGSLRTLLPAQYNNKGKLSVSDRVQEAANYIKDIQNKINQLKNRRDELKKLTKPDENRSSRSRDNYHNCVTVNPSSDGVEILINANNFEDEEGQLPISTILKELIEIREFNVVSCLSTNNTDHGRSLHKIQLEVSNNPTLKDLLGLQERLTVMINACSYGSS